MYTAYTSFQFGGTPERCRNRHLQGQKHDRRHAPRWRSNRQTLCALQNVIPSHKRDANLSKILCFSPLDFYLQGFLNSNLSISEIRQYSKKLSRVVFLFRLLHRVAVKTTLHYSKLLMHWRKRRRAGTRKSKEVNPPCIELYTRIRRRRNCVF